MNCCHLARALARSTSTLAIVIGVISGAQAFAQDASTPPAQAQAAPADSSAAAKPDNGPVIVVTGYRASLTSALANKRHSDLFLDSIVPEDIGKFPDQNVAESLQRLPGVQIDRTNGQGTAVLIDGLRQNLTLLNGEVFLTGREFYVSGEGSGGGAGANSQYASLEGIPSEEIGGIDVFKNPQASMAAGGIGGTIDLKSINPLAAKLGLSVSGNLRGTTSSGAGAVTPDGAVIAQYKFSDNFAVFAAVSYDREKTLTDTFQNANRNAWVMSDFLTAPTPGVGLSTANFVPGPSYVMPQLAYFTNDNDDRRVFGASAGFSAKLSDDLSADFVWFHSHENDIDIQYSDKVYFNGSGLPSTNAADPTTAFPGLVQGSPYSIGAHGIIQNGTIYANGAETATLYQHTTDHADNFQAKFKFDNGEGLRVNWGGAYSRAASDLEADQADVEHGQYNTAAGVPTTPTAPGCNNGAAMCSNPGYTFNYTNGGTSGLPTVAYNSDVLSNPNYVLFKSNWAWANRTKQTAWDVHADVAKDIHDGILPALTLSAGLRGSGRDVTQIFGRYLISSPDGSLFDGIAPGGGNYTYYVDPAIQGMPYSTALTNPNLALTVNGFGVGPMTVKNPWTGGMTNPSTYLNTVWSQAGVGGATNNTERFFEDTLSSFNVSEKDLSGYLMGDIGGKSDKYHLNIGVRFVTTWLTIDNAESNPEGSTFYGTQSWNGVNSNNIPVTTNREYTDILPSLNFLYKLDDRQIIRLGAAKVMAPQDLFALGLGNSYNYTRRTGSLVPNIYNGSSDGYYFDGGSSGNPHLDPYRAWQGIASYENYFAPGSVASVGAFYKKVESFVEQVNVPTTMPDDFGGDTANVLEYMNAGSGYIYGLELGGQYLFRNFLKGFGVAANYTFSQSSASLPTDFSTKAPIPGVSKHAFTINGFYEAHGFSARLSYSWRSRAINDSGVGSTMSFKDQNNNMQTYEIFSAPYGQLDGQIGYDFNKYAGLVFSAQNITKASQHTYVQWPDQPYTYNNWGRRIFFGVKFKY